MGRFLEPPLYIGVIMARLRSVCISPVFGEASYSSWRGWTRLLLHCLRSITGYSSGLKVCLGHLKISVPLLAPPLASLVVFVVITVGLLLLLLIFPSLAGRAGPQTRGNPRLRGLVCCLLWYDCGIILSTNWELGAPKQSSGFSTCSACCVV